MEKKSAHNFESLSLLFSFAREDECLVAPDHDAPSRVLNRLGFAAFVLDFPDVCRKKEKRRHGGAKAQKRECRFLRERDALVDPRHCVFGAAFVSLIFSKIGRRDGFSDPPRDARARKRERERVERERERRNDDDDDRRRLLRWSRAYSKLSDADGKRTTTLSKRKKERSTRERERE